MNTRTLLFPMAITPEPFQTSGAAKQEIEKMYRTRTRGNRRDLTYRYQKRQLRLRKLFGGYYYLSTDLSLAAIGRLRRQSFNDCGQPQCCFCTSPRYSKWSSNNEKLTMAERRHAISFKEQVKDYDG